MGSGVTDTVFPSERTCGFHQRHCRKAQTIVRRIADLIPLLLTVLASCHLTRGDTKSRVSGLIGAGRRVNATRPLITTNTRRC